MAPATLSLTVCVLLAVAAALVGFAKTAIGGAGALAVVIFAAALPTRASTGALLPLLLVGDLVAVAVYRRHASLSTLLRLLPGVLPGFLLGAWLVAVVDDSAMRTAIGLVLLAMTGLQLVQMRGRRSDPGRRALGATPHPVLTVLAGAVAGFATMTANAAGPVITIYLLLGGLTVLEIVGTGAWFFLAVNVAKVPFSASLSLISRDSLQLDAILVPALLVGAVAGGLAIRHIDRRQFEVAALGLGGVAAFLLLV